MGSQEIASTRFAGDANLEAYYKLEDVNDSKNTYNLTNNGTVTFSAAKFGNGADLGASNSSKYLSIASNLGITNKTFSMLTWVKLNTEIASGRYGFLYLGQTTTDNSYEIRYEYNSGTRRLWFTMSRPGTGYSDSQIFYNITLGTSVYHQIALTGDGTSIRAYVDGTYVGIANVNANGTNIANYFVLGASDNTLESIAEYASAIFDDTAVFSRTLTSDEIYSLYKTGVKKLNGQVNLNPELESSSLRGDANLLAYWRFEGNSLDETANNNDGTDTNITYGTAYGKMGQGALFNGTSSIITTTDILDGQSTISFGGWFKWDGDYGLFIFKNDCLMLGRYDLTTYFRWRIRTSSGWYGTSNIEYPASYLNNWHFIVGTWDKAAGSNNLKLYIDGSLWSVGTTDNNVLLSGDSIILGGRSLNNEWYGGCMDDVFIMNRALSATEISNLYNTNIKKYMGVSNV